jgi:DNA-binding transcriptional LysR family regulator
MDITQIKTFLEVYRTRHFGRAATNLFVTQSAVSARIRQLEDQLGTSLFTRDRNNIQPTSAGQKLFKHADSILMTWNRIRLEIAIEDKSKIPVIIAGVPGLWDIYLDKWIRKARQNYPDIVFTCEAISPETLHNRLLEGSVDIGFAYEPPHHPDLVANRIITITLIMVSSKKNLTASEAVKSDYVFIDWGTSFAVSHAGYFPDIPVPAMRIGLANIARKFLIESGGSGYLPDVMVKKDLRAGDLFRVRGAPKIVREAFAVYKKGNEEEQYINDLLKQV